MEDKNLVEKAMKELGVNQRDLSNLSGVHENTLIKWKKGEQEPPKWAYVLFDTLIKYKNCKEKLDIVDKFADIITKR